MSSPDPPPPEDLPVEVEPCPRCRARLSVLPADLWVPAECPSCRTVFTPRPRGSAHPPAGPLPPDARSGQPAPRSAGPGRRDGDARPRRRGGPADRIISSVISLVVGVVFLVCGVAAVVAGDAFFAFLGVGGPAEPGKPPRRMATAECVGCGASLLLLAAVYLPAGVGALARKRYGIAMTLATVPFSAVAALGCSCTVFGPLLAGNFGRAHVNALWLALLAVHIAASLRATLGRGSDDFE